MNEQHPIFTCEAEDAAAAADSVAAGGATTWFTGSLSIIPSSSKTWCNPASNATTPSQEQKKFSVPWIIHGTHTTAQTGGTWAAPDMNFHPWIISPQRISENHFQLWILAILWHTMLYPKKNSKTHCNTKLKIDQNCNFQQQTICMRRTALFLQLLFFFSISELNQHCINLNWNPNFHKSPSPFFCLLSQLKGKKTSMQTYTHIFFSKNTAEVQTLT